MWTSEEAERPNEEQFSTIAAAAERQRREGRVKGAYGALNIICTARSRRDGMRGDQNHEKEGEERRRTATLADLSSALYIHAEPRR